MDSSRRREIEGIRQALVRGIASAKVGETEVARYYLRMVIDRRGEPHQLVEAYYYLSLIETDNLKKKELLETILSLQPSDPRARRSLALLDGTLVVEDIINPDLPGKSEVESELFVAGLRHECPQCGSALRFDPESGTRICQHCGFRETAEVDATLPTEHNFIIGAATRRGHASPRPTQLFQCSACGTMYLYEGAKFGLVCSHCDAAFSSGVPFIRDLIAPSGLYLPMTSLHEAEDLVRQWWSEHDLVSSGALEKATGLYLPVWTFDFGGVAHWSAEVYKDQEWGPVLGTKLVDINDFMVPASPLAKELLGESLASMQSHQPTTYEPRHIAGWLAESYTLAMADAAVGARGSVVSRMRNRIQRDIVGNFRRLSLQTQEIIVESYKLVLVPVWHSHYSLGGMRYSICANAVTGEIAGRLPPTRWERFMRRIRGT